MEQGLAVLKQTQNKRLIAQTLRLLGDLARMQGDMNLAKTSYEGSLHLSRDLEDKQREAHLLHKLGYVAYHSNDNSLAKSLFQQALTLAYQHKHVRALAESIAGLARVAGWGGQWSRATALLGMAEAQLQTIQLSLSFLAYAEQAEIEDLIANLQQQLNTSAFAAAWAEGAEMTLEQAVAYALAETA
jgi:hypothetical protein